MSQQGTYLVVLHARNTNTSSEHITQSVNTQRKIQAVLSMNQYPPGLTPSITLTKIKIKAHSKATPFPIAYTYNTLQFTL
jgi:hypothetical protein